MPIRSLRSLCTALAVALALLAPAPARGGTDGSNCQYSSSTGKCYCALIQLCSTGDVACPSGGHWGDVCKEIE